MTARRIPVARTILALCLCLCSAGSSISAASEADQRLRKCIEATLAIGKRQQNLPNGSGCRENRKRMREMSRIGDEIRKLRRGVCNPRRISGGEISLAQAEGLVTSWEENGKSLASLLKTERSLQAALCR